MIVTPHPFLRRSALVLALCSAFAAALVPATAHAGLFDDEEARKALLDLRKEVREANAAQDRRVDDLLRQLQTTLETKLEASADGKLDAAKRTQLELSNQLTQSREEQAKLRGQLEMLGNELATQQRRTRDLEAALDARLKKLEPRTMAVDGKEAVVDKSEESAFNAALNQFKAGDYKAASAAFQNYVAQYPQSGLLASAYFWLGNSQYANRDAKNALISLQTMLQKAGDHPRAADAHLTTGHCYNELGDKKNAQKAFAYVVATYPNTAAADAAAQQLPKPVEKPKKK
jgi:tol-pal system protein YbgF